MLVSYLETAGKRHAEKVAVRGQYGVVHLELGAVARADGGVGAETLAQHPGAAGLCIQ